MKKNQMSDKELLAYITTHKYYCRFCSDLKKEVLEKGLVAIDEYDGMICGSVEDMFEKRGRW